MDLSGETTRTSPQGVKGHVDGEGQRVARVLRTVVMFCGGSVKPRPLSPSSSSFPSLSRRHSPFGYLDPESTGELPLTGPISPQSTLSRLLIRNGKRTTPRELTDKLERLGDN